jgi:starch synthase
LIRRDEFFDRPGLYGGPDGDYPDNPDRFIFFSRAALDLIRALRRRPDIVHCHDWHTGLIPAYLAETDREGGFFRDTRTVFTIHNLAYQGVFPEEVMDLTGLPHKLYHWEGLEFFGKVNFLKAGIVYADRITTVSPGYAREILTPEFGEGLEGALRKRRSRLSGILNGVDEALWDPRRDPFLPANFGPGDLSGKRVCRAGLLKRLGLDAPPDTPVAGVVSRLVRQKGIDLLMACLEDLMKLGVILVMLGSGDDSYRKGLRDLQRRYPGRLSLTLGFDEGLAHLIEAGSDLFLMPSRYEPCGLNQMYSLKYGTIPVVRAVGGLDNSVVEFDSATGRGNGFKFKEFRPDALLSAVRKALAVLVDPDLRAGIQSNGMRADFSWKRAARSYIRLYRRAMEEIRA